MISFTTSRPAAVRTTLTSARTTKSVKTRWQRSVSQRSSSWTSTLPSSRNFGKRSAKCKVYYKSHLVYSAEPVSVGSAPSYSDHREMTDHVPLEKRKEGEDAVVQKKRFIVPVISVSFPPLRPWRLGRPKEIYARQKKRGCCRALPSPFLGGFHQGSILVIIIITIFIFLKMLRLRPPWCWITSSNNNSSSRLCHLRHLRNNSNQQQGGYSKME